MVASVAVVIAPSDTAPGDIPDTPEQRRPTIAIAVAGVGALLVGSASLIGVVTPHTPPAFQAWPLLLVLAALPPALAAVFRSRSRLASALLIAPAGLAPGRIVLDTQLIVDAGRAARPELLYPSNLHSLSPSVGLWLLFAGHVLAMAAGLLALRGRVRDLGSSTGAFGGELADNTPVVRNRGLLVTGLGAAAAGGVGLLMAQFVSKDPFLMPRAALDATPLVLAGSILTALLVFSIGGYLAASGEPDFARGGLLGLALALAGLVVPPLFAATVVEELNYSWGPVLTLVAALILALLAIPAGRTANPDAAEELRLPAFDRMLTLSGALSLASGLSALLAAITPQLEMPDGLRDPAVFPARMLLPAGVILVLLGAGLLIPRIAAVVRPLLSIAWVGVVLAGSALLDTVYTATQAARLSVIQLAGPQLGPGPWVAGLAMLLAALAAVAAAAGGAVERDDVDLTEITARRGIAVPALVGALLGVGAFALPVVTAPGYTPPGLISEFGTASWGLVLGLLAVLAAGALAPLCRPSRGAALLGGAGLVLLQRALELPLTVGRIEGSTAGLGLWAALAGLLVMLSTATLTARS